MGPGRKDAQSLTGDEGGGSIPHISRSWPIVVRRAREADRAAVLAFATDTWNGHDYIPNAWPVWLEAADGAFLVATVGEPGGNDADGNALEVGAPIAVTRIAMVNDGEAWLEGIRVHPRVRGMGVASDLQVAELHWVVAQDARVVRYATSWRNEASHRLGARDGIETVARFRSWWWSPSGAAATDGDEPSAFDADVRSAATALRQRALETARHAGLVVSRDSADVGDLWRRIDTDPTFALGQRLYEARAWAMGELTRSLFERHVDRGEVVLLRGRPTTGAWAAGIIVREQFPSEDAALRFSLLVGDGAAAASLADEIRAGVGETIRFRLPKDAPLVTGHERDFAAAGLVSPEEWEMHILARPMDGGFPLPRVDAARLVISEAPDRLVPPRI